MNINENDLKRIIKEEIAASIKRHAKLNEEEMPTADDVFQSEPTEVNEALVPYFMAGAVVAAKLGPNGNYMEFEAHDDIRVEARNYFLALEKFKEMNLPENKRFSSEKEMNAWKKKRRELQLFIQGQTKMPLYLEKGKEIYDRFVEHGQEFLEDYIPHIKTQGGLGRIKAVQAFFSGSGSADINALKSIGIVLRDFLRWEKGSGYKRGLDKKEVDGSEDVLGADKDTTELEGIINELKSGLNSIVSDFSQRGMSSKEDAKAFNDELRGFAGEISDKSGISLNLIMTCIRFMLGQSNTSERIILSNMQRELDDKNAHDTLRDTVANNGGRLS